MHDPTFGRESARPAACSDAPDNLIRATHNSLAPVRVLVVVEGQFDIQFLRRLSRILHADDPRLPDLIRLEQAGELIFVPIAGGNILAWTGRLAPLGIPEFHIYDRELPPETATRERAVEQVNRRYGCQAVLTLKRNLENYLHPDAILEARGIPLRFGDFDDVPELAAQACYTQRAAGTALGPWDEIPARMRKRLRDRAKHWLNTWAVDRMTLEKLAERDTAGDVQGWLESIAHLANNTTHRETP